MYGDGRGGRGGAREGFPQERSLPMANRHHVFFQFWLRCECNSYLIDDGKDSRRRGEDGRGGGGGIIGLTHLFCFLFGRLNFLVYCM